MKHIIFTIIILSSLFSSAQYSSTGGFSNITGDFIGYGITSDLSGNILICGIGGPELVFPTIDGQLSLTCSDAYDGVVCKLNPNGECLWAASFGSISNNSEWANSIVADDEENVYVAGNFIGLVDFDPSENETILNGGTGDGYLVKLNSNGELIWVKTISGSGVDRAHCVTISQNGEILVSGIMGTNGYIGDPSHPMLAGETGTFIASFDSDGNVNWHKSLITTGSSNIVSITSDGDSNIYGTGLFSSTMDLDPSEGEFILEEIGGQDGCFFKLDSEGNFIWGGQFSSGGQDWGYDIAVNENNEAFIVGVFQDEATISNGTNDYTVSAPTGSRALLLKLTVNGDVAWAYPVEGDASTRGQCVEIDANGDIWFGGFFNGTSDFDPSNELFNYTSQGSTDAFVLQLNTDGDFLNAFQLGGELGQQFRSIFCTTENELLLTGVTHGDTDFDISQNADVQTVSDKSAFYLKIISNTQFVEDVFRNTEKIFYPNLIGYSDKSIRLNASGTFSLYNSSGARIAEYGWRRKGTTIYIDEPSGLYFIRMNSFNQEITERLVIQD